MARTDRHRRHDGLSVSRVWSQVRDPMILLLLAAGTLTAVLGDVPDTVIIAAVVVFNTLTGVIQEVRADRAVDALRDLTPSVAHVHRDGVLVELPTDDVVPGDAACAERPATSYPADGVVATSSDLEIDESTMTGEALPVSVGDGDDVTGGTLVTRGKAVGGRSPRPVRTAAWAASRR